MKQELLQHKIILLVGMMGAGKTSLGRILSKKLHIPFIDSDKEIEHSTGFTISELFSRFGEEEFRKGEELVMERLLKQKPCILSSGGGAFLSPKTRENAKKYAVSVWIKADTKVISRRTQGRTHRPLIPSFDNAKAVDRLIKEHYPVYAQADITVESFNESPYKTAKRLMHILQEQNIVSCYEPTPKETK